MNQGIERGLTDIMLAIKAKFTPYTGSSYIPIVSTPTGTAPTYTGTVSGKYTIIDGWVDAIIYLSNTTGGVAGSGTSELVVSLPVAADSYSLILGFGAIYESGGRAGGVFCRYASPTSFYFHTGDFANIVANDQSSTSRYMTFNLRYRAA